MLVKCQFKSHFAKSGYGEKEYTYRCEFPVQVGDIVKVPAGDGTGTARISAINVKESSVPSNVLPLLKEVTCFATYEDTLFHDEPEAPALPEIELAENIIVIKQLPVIEDQLRTLREQVEGKVKEALSLAVTEDTVIAVKDVRAALRKEYADLEARRKQVKLAILEPYDKFEATYRECIGDLYTDADQKLREKIDAVENGVKEQKRAALKEYFEEYRRTVYLQDEPLADFEKWGVSITKTASDKSLRQAAKAYLDMIRSDLDTIATMENADEILVEYKNCRELGKSISVVNERARLKEEERRRRADAAAERAAREAAEKAAMAKVEEAAAAARPEPLAPPVEAPKAAPAKDPNQVFPKAAFTLYNVKRYQLAYIKNYLIQEGIQYE